MKTCFHSHFYANFHDSVTAIFVGIFMKFLPKCRTKKLRIKIHHFGKFLLILNWESTVIRPQIRLRKIPEKLSVGDTKKELNGLVLAPSLKFPE